MTKTAQEFIQSSFSPLIATLCSPKVESIVSKNNLSLVELLQPFTSLEWEGQIREPGGTVCLVKNIKLVIRDVNWKPLQPTEARRRLNNAVLYNYDEQTVKLNIDGGKLEIPVATPWFEAWKETYFDVQFPSDHEFTKHFLSCIIVGTTQDDNLIDTYNALNQQYAQLQNVTPPKLPKWFNNSVLKTYLLLNDASVLTKDKPDQAFETLKQNFGAGNCYMLTINSKTPGDPKLPNDYWIKFIKRPIEAMHDNISYSATNLSTSLVESQANVQVNTPEETIVHVIQENTHPLTTAENDVYDNGNSLQTYSFSGSSESVNVIGKQMESVNEVHGMALNAVDIEAIKKFLVDYTSQALVPYVEKLIGQLNEVVANKKGVSRSLLSATKRWFTTGKAGSASINNAVIYSSDCPELQLRRLGDLWFLFGQWQRAFDAYHTAKREFYADSAWLCYAGALEMAAISAFMCGESNRKTLAYMEESITTYLNTCRMVQYAVRATLLSIPCLISAGLYGEAAKQLIRMTSEDSDLRSAMLLEQAALCFLKGPSNKIMTRKYAFHIVLAGHRFSKAGQKKHAYRCYEQAYQVYRDSGWRLSSDHVQFALGRLAGALRRPAAAARWLAAPLAPAPRQPVAQQDAFLREFMMAHQQWVESCEDFKAVLPELPVPRVGAGSVLCAGPAPLSSPGRAPATSLSLPPAPDHDDPIWPKLEEILLQVARGSVPMIFKPTTDLYTQKTDSNPVTCQGEPIQISITLHNPLKVTLHLKDLELLWQFSPDFEEDKTYTPEQLQNESALASGTLVDKYAIHGQKLKSVLLEGETTQNLIFTLTPLKTGQLSIQGLALKLLNAGETKEAGKGVAILGKLNLQRPGSDSDKLFIITVIPHAPCLQMTFTEVDTDVISGEIKTVDVVFTNATSVDMRNLHLAVSHPDCMSVITSDTEKAGFKALYNDKYREPPDYPDERAARAAARARAAVRAAVRVVGERARLLLRPRARALYLLAYYETGLPRRPYRLIRHVFRFEPTEVVKIYVTPRRGLSTMEDKVLENIRLAVEVKNVTNEKEEDITLEVLEASLLSRQWKLVEFTSAIEQDNCLKSRERAHFVLKGVRILHELPEYRIDHSSIKMSKHPESNTDIDMPPYCKFVTDEMSSVTDSIESLMQEIDKSGLIRSMIILRWRSQNNKTGKVAIGQHCLWLDCFTKAVSRDRKQTYTNLVAEPPNLDLLDSKTLKGKNEKNNVVVFKLDHSNIVDHNFNKYRICMVPVIINVVNCYGVPVTVFIDLSKQQQRDHGGLGWAGALNSGLDADSKQVGVKVTLEKFESRSLQVRALCAAPGTYQVGSSFAVTTTMGPESKGTTHFVNNTSLLIIKQVV